MLKPDTRNLYKLSACLLPFMATFSERSLGKSLVLLCYIIRAKYFVRLCRFINLLW
jgi:hypothetical protein